MAQLFSYTYGILCRITSFVINCSAYYPVIYHLYAEDTCETDFQGVHRKSSDFPRTRRSEIADIESNKTEA